MRIFWAIILVLGAVAYAELPDIVQEPSNREVLEYIDAKLDKNAIDLQTANNTIAGKSKNGNRIGTGSGVNFIHGCTSSPLFVIDIATTTSATNQAIWIYGMGAGGALQSNDPSNTSPATPILYATDTDIYVSAAQNVLNRKYFWVALCR